MKERWVSIKDYEGYYDVSNFGRVRSLRSTGYRLRKSPFILKPGISHGYHSVVLSKRGKVKHKRVHRLVATAFIKNSSLWVHHKDNNKRHNHLKNLEYVTPRQNSVKHYQKGNYASKYIGVKRGPRDKNWVVNISFQGKQHYIGYCKSEQKCATAYQQLLKVVNSTKKVFEKRLLEVRKEMKK